MNIKIELNEDEIKEAIADFLRREKEVPVQKNDVSFTFEAGYDQLDRATHTKSVKATIVVKEHLTTRKR